MAAASDVPITDLPVETCIADVRAALASSPSGADPAHVVLQAPPGAGKTTIVPLRLLDAPWLQGGRILMLEPRRLATRAAAQRMADLLGEPVGDTVGYRTRDERRVGRRTRIEVVTEGILTRRLQQDASLPGTALVIFDEVHERNLQTDLALALTLDARAVLRPDLRVLAMSATLDTERVARLLGGSADPAPIVTSEGRSFPIDVRWRPLGPRDRMAEATASVVGEALRADDGDVLVFLAGAADIRRVQRLLSQQLRGTAVDVRPLFGALSRADQDAALRPSPPGRRRIVLATDIAETSLTVEGVRIVVDSGEVRVPRYDIRTGLTRLRTTTTSRASADQRCGRAGRTGPGVAYRLWSTVEHRARPAFAAAEITQVDLAGPALELAVWGTPVDELRFLDPPPTNALAEARSLLAELGALDESGRATPRGRAMADLPLHPRLARMVVQGNEMGLGSLACTVAALLDERDVLRGRPDVGSTDIAERVRLVAGDRWDDPRLDRDTLRLVRRRAGELRQRLSIGRRTGGDGRPDEGDEGDADRAGLVLALAYPDRLAQARGDGRFRLRNGAAAQLPTGDSLLGETYLVVADLDTGQADARIRLAAGLDEADVAAAAGPAVETRTRLGWDSRRNDLRVRRERRVGAIVLTATDGPAEPGDETRAALLDQVRATRMGVLRWTTAARTLQGQVAFLRAAEPRSDPARDGWPDLSDDGLLATLDDWLAPHLWAATGRADLEALDVHSLLRNHLGHHRVAELQRLLPRTVPLASGRQVPVDYRGDRPNIAVRAQELFGTTTHPTIADGRVPLVVHVLSPAGRPVQVTADLPGFWAGSWAEVRKDMAGRYPKHDWPPDPANAAPRTTRRGGSRHG